MPLSKKSYWSENDSFDSENDVEDTPLIAAVKQGDEKLVEELIKNGANIETEDFIGNTPLMLAIELNYESIVDLLLQNGASCFVENNYYNTPLHSAVHNNLQSIVQKLINAKIDVSLINSLGETPMDIALTKSNIAIARNLIAQGACVSAGSAFRSLLNCFPPHLENFTDFLLEIGFDVNTKGNQNTTLLHIAVIKQNEVVVRKLLERGADVNASDKMGDTSLLFASRGRSVRIVQLLLQNQANINVLNALGQTPLYIAVAFRSVEIVRFLLNAGGKITSMNKITCPLNLAIETRTIPRSIKSLLLNGMKMKLAKMEVHLLQNDKKSQKFFHTVELFKDECLEELSRMKIKMFGGISLNRIFLDWSNPLYVNNSDMKAYVKSEFLRREFPRYADLLIKKYKDGAKRNMLLDRVNLRVVDMKCKRMVKLELPNELNRKILIQLNYFDLLHLKKAFEISK